MLIPWHLLPRKPRELSTLLWAVAVLGDPITTPTGGAHQLRRLAHAALARMQQLPLYDGALAAWALLLMSPSAAGDDSSSGDLFLQPAAVWSALTQRISRSAVTEIDEAVAMVIMRAAMEAAAQEVARRLAAGFSLAPSSSNSNSAAAGAAGAAEGGTAAVTANRAAALPGPRASREEVEGLLSTAPAAVRRRVLEVYQVGDEGCWVWQVESIASAAPA